MRVPQRKSNRGLEVGFEMANEESIACDLRAGSAVIYEVTIIKH